MINFTDNVPISGGNDISLSPLPSSGHFSIGNVLNMSLSLLHFLAQRVTGRAGECPSCADVSQGLYRIWSVGSLAFLCFTRILTDII